MFFQFTFSVACKVVMYGIFCAKHILFLYNRFFPIRIRRCIFEHLDRTAVPSATLEPASLSWTTAKKAITF